MSGYLIGPMGVLPAAGGGGITLTPASGGLVVVSSQPASFTITGLNGGTNFPANSVVVLAFYNHDASGGINTPKIGGQSAGSVTSDGNNMFLYSTLVGGSSIADTFSGLNGNFYSDMLVRAWILSGASSATASATLAVVAGGADPQILTGQPISVPSGGVGVVALGCSNPTAGTTTLWGTPSGSTSPDASGSSGTVYLFSSWNGSSSGNWDPGVTGSNSLAFKNNVMVAATFSP